MEGQSECIRYLVEQLMKEKHREVGLCRTDSTHPVLNVKNNLGQSPRALAQRFYKHDAVDTIDHLLSQLKTSADNDGSKPTCILNVFSTYTRLMLNLLKWGCMEKLFMRTVYGSLTF